MIYYTNMKTRREFISVVSVFAMIVISGCRRQDIKSYMFEVPKLTPENKDLVIKALSRYAGIDKSSYVFDFKAKTITLSYDSMQLAKTNIRMAVATALEK